MPIYNLKIEWQTRLCTVNGETGYFHTWEQFSTPVEPSPLVDGHPGGTLSRVYGIVEFENRVDRVSPTSIKFCDEENATLHLLNENRKKENKNEAQ